MDPLRIVEAAYRWESSEDAWLDGVVAAATPFAVGGGVVACLVQCSPAPQVLAHASEGVSDEGVDAIVRVCNAVDPGVAATFFAPTEFVGNAAWRLERLARGMSRPTADLIGGVPLPPVWALIGGAPHEAALVLVFPSARNGLGPDVPFPGDHSHMLGMVAAHLGAALRLRSLAPPARTGDDETEAVLSPDGKVLHATGDAVELRSSLTEAVLRSERARSHLRKVDATEATELWSALVEGKWSVLEATERDGKRFLLARKNTLRPPRLSTEPARPPDLIDLKKEESDVVWLAVQGHSHKYIAYELGLSAPTVARRLRAAMDKLRVGSRRELLRKLGVPDA